MISKSDLEIIKKISKKYGVKKVFLFGSAKKDASLAHDIDLAVEGIEPKLFFKYGSELYLNLSKPVDLVDLSINDKITQLIKQEAVLIYG